MPIVLTAVPDAKLLIAGEIYGSDQTYTALISELGIEARVEAHFSYIPDSSVAGFFQRASLCVRPYRRASQRGVIALSYAFDLPVLASRLEGLEQYVDEGRTGLLVNAVPEPRPEDLARELIRYFKGSLYETMTPYVSKKGAEFSWSRLERSLSGLVSIALGSWLLPIVPQTLSRACITPVKANEPASSAADHLLFSTLWWSRGTTLAEVIALFAEGRMGSACFDYLRGRLSSAG
jgi:hypothetical protein